MCSTASIRGYDCISDVFQSTFTDKIRSFCTPRMNMSIFGAKYDRILFSIDQLAAGFRVKCTSLLKTLAIENIRSCLERWLPKYDRMQAALSYSVPPALGCCFGCDRDDPSVHGQTVPGGRRMCNCVHRARVHGLSRLDGSHATPSRSASRPYRCVSSADCLRWHGYSMNVTLRL